MGLRPRGSRKITVEAANLMSSDEQSGQCRNGCGCRGQKARESLPPSPGFGFCIPAHGRSPNPFGTAMNESATKPSDLGVTILFQAFVAIRFENIPHLVAPQGCSPFRHYSVYYQIFGYLNVLGRSFYKNLALVIRPSFIVGAL